MNKPTMPEHLKRVRRDNKLGIRGVYYDEFKRRYVVQKTIDGKRYHLGYVDTPEQGRQLWESAHTRADSPNVVFTTAPPPDFTAGFKQTLAYLTANGRSEEAAIVQAALDRIQALKSAGSNVQ